MRMGRRNRLLSVILAFVLFIALLPVVTLPASAATANVSSETDLTSAITAFNSGLDDMTINVTSSFSVDNGYTIDNSSYTLTIQGNNAATTLTFAGATGNFFTINGSKLALESIILDGNNISRSGRLVSISGGSLTLNNGAILQNNKTTNYGSGVYATGGAIIMNNGSYIRDNEAGTNTTYGTYGGGVYITSSSTSFTMNGGTISGNKATGETEVYGGGAFVTNGASFAMSGGASISGNSVYGANRSHGGGVYVTGTGTSFTMTGSTISNNSILYIKYFEQYSNRKRCLWGRRGCLRQCVFHHE